MSGRRQTAAPWPRRLTVGPRVSSKPRRRPPAEGSARVAGSLVHDVNEQLVFAGALGVLWLAVSLLKT